MDKDQRIQFKKNAQLPPEGRQRLFEQLWKAYRPALRAYLRSFSALSPEDADELASDILLKAYDKAALYDPEQPFEPWLFTLARRSALDALRSQQRHRHEVLAQDSLGDPRSPGPEESCLQSHEQAAIAQFLAGRPQKERELAFLVYGQGLSLPEASRIVAEPLGTVKWRIATLKAALKKTLEVHA